MKNKTQNAQKVLVRSVNECLRAGIFTLQPQEGKLPVLWHEFDIAGIPAIVAVNDAGHGELSVKVTLWPTEQGRKLAEAVLCGPQKLRERGGFLAHTWLDRSVRPRLAIHGDNLTAYCEKSRVARIETMPWENPEGFEAGSRVHA